MSSKVREKRFRVLKNDVKIETVDGLKTSYLGDTVTLNDRHAIVTGWLTGRIEPADLPLKGKFQRPSGEVVEMSWDQALPLIRTNLLFPCDDFDFLGLKG